MYYVCITGHLRITPGLLFQGSPGAHPSYEKISAKTRFDKEAKGNSEMTYYECIIPYLCIRYYALCMNDFHVQLAQDSQPWRTLLHVVGSTHGEALNDSGAYFPSTQEPYWLIDRLID